MNSYCARRSPPYSTGHAPRATRALVEPSWHVLSPGCRAVCIQTSRRRGRRVVRRVEEFDLSSAVGVGGLTAAAGIAIRSASCQQPRVADFVGAAAAIGLLRRRSTASPPIRPAQLLQLLQLLLSVFCSHSPRADCAPRQAGHMLMQTVRELGCAA